MESLTADVYNHALKLINEVRNMKNSLVYVFVCITRKY